MFDARFVWQTRARKVPYLPIIFCLVLTISFCCALYASLSARGLYHDGVYYLMRVAERQGFHLTDPARTTVQILRQAPIVALSRFTSMSLFGRGQVFTFVMLAFPPLLCGLCWFVAPRDRKVWVLFPLTFLLTGFAATSIHAIGEAAIATAYFWLLLFMVLFRSNSWASRALLRHLEYPRDPVARRGVSPHHRCLAGLRLALAVRKGMGCQPVRRSHRPLVCRDSGLPDPLDHLAEYFGRSRRNLRRLAAISIPLC